MIIRFLTYLRSAWSFINLLGSTFLSGLVSLIIFPLPCKHRAFNWIVRLWANWNLLAAGIRVEVHGLENIQDSSYIIISNHESALDIFVIFARLPLHFRMVSKIGMLKIPLVGYAMKKHLFPLVDRSNSDEAIESMNTTFKKLRHNQLSVCVFPEGTRHGGKKLLPFKKGAFVLALEHRIPLLPVVLMGTGDVTPAGSLWVRPGRVTMDVLKPIPVRHLTREDRDRLIKRTETLFKEFLHKHNYYREV
jgi:1-acyl-sn-glycerol-3-phosphate acyltransferase